MIPEAPGGVPRTALKMNVAASMKRGYNLATDFSMQGDPP